MLTQEQKQLIRDLNSYNYLHVKLADMTEQYDKTLKHIKEEITNVESLLNEFHTPPIRYDEITIKSVPTTKNTRVIELITEKDILVKKLKDIEDKQIREVHKIAQRIEDVDIMLHKLNNWEKLFITKMYIESQCIDYMLDNYKYKSKTSIYNTASKILDKMLK